MREDSVSAREGGTRRCLDSNCQNTRDGLDMLIKGS